MKKGFLKSLADSRKLKYSSLNMAFVAIVLAIVIALNAVITLLAGNFNWYIDMTDEQIFSLSDEAKSLLDSSNKDVELEIVFPCDKDVLEGKYSVSEKNGAIGYINATAQQIAGQCPNITVSYHDVDKDYKFYAEEVGGGANLKANDETILIVRKDANGNYVNGDYRVYPINYFYVVDSDTNSLYAYNGELIFISAILSMTRNTVPTVYFTVGHGEQSLSTEVNYDTIYEAAYKGKVDSKAAELIAIFCDSGFMVKPLDLATSDIPSDANMIVINQPTYDFDEEQLDKLTQYLQNKGVLFAFTPHDAELSNLYARFEQNYGVKVNPSATPIVDDGANGTKFDNRPNSFLANVSTDDNSFATSNYFKSLSSFSSAKARFDRSATLTINPDFMTTSGYSDGMGVRKYTYPLLETSKYAEFGGAKGVYSVMSITSIARFNQATGDETYSYLVVCPSSDFASESKEGKNFLTDGVSPNKHMILSLIQATSSVRTPVNIDYKPFMSYKLTITDSQARTTMSLLATIIPAIIAVTGTVVIVRRKHR